MTVERSIMIVFTSLILKLGTIEAIKILFKKKEDAEKVLGKEINEKRFLNIIEKIKDEINEMEKYKKGDALDDRQSTAQYKEWLKMTKKERKISKAKGQIKLY